jgi:hypothetical protein
MMLSKAVKFLLLTEAFAVATYALGWWGVPVLALICGLAIEPKARPLRFIGLCAAAGWASLLLLDAARGPLGELARRFGAVMSLPPVVLILITLLFPALLAWSAASIGVAVRRMIPGGDTQPAVPATEPIATAGSGGVAMADV